MRLSVLLPTRNGGALLHDCVKSVLDQPFEDMELIVSDNASEDETRDVLAGFHDDRLRVVRLDEPIPVTDNWNNALAHSTGGRSLRQLARASGTRTTCRPYTERNSPRASCSVPLMPERPR